MGLVRKSKGTLLLTKVGEAAQRSVDVLCKHLAGRLIPKSGDQFHVEATLLVLAYAAVSGGSDLPFTNIYTHLSDLGCRQSDGSAVTMYPLPLWVVLANVTDQPVSFREMHRVSSAAAALARSALRP